MSSKNETAQSGGIGLCGLVFVLFLALKLIGITVVASWSWWWITAPLWGPTAFVLGLLTVGLLIALLVKVVTQ